MRPYYEDPFVTIYHGDCRELLRHLHFEGAWALIVDPPYGIQHSSNYGASWEGSTIAGDDSTGLRDWLLSQFREWPAVVFGTWKRARPSAVRAVLAWDKGPAFGMGDLSLPWKPSWEEVYVIGDGFDGRREEGVLRGFSHVSWESKGRRHPHEKPADLMAHFVAKLPGRSILDPCCGTGPVLVAAKARGRKAIGIEIEERYCEIAAERCSQGVLELEAS